MAKSSMKVPKGWKVAATMEEARDADVYINKIRQALALDWRAALAPLEKKFDLLSDQLSGVSKTAYDAHNLALTTQSAIQLLQMETEYLAVKLEEESDRDRKRNVKEQLMLEMNF